MMTLKRALPSLPLALLFLGLPPALAETPDRGRLDAAARAFMERTSAPGLAIGVVTPAGAQVLSYGVASKETGAPVDERTVFEVGSISKTFTVTLASYAAEIGALKWDASPGQYIPELKATALDQVSLRNLATHTTGGMPLQLPDEVKTDAGLMDYFRKWSPPSRPGSVRTYANPSIGLLGVVTSRALKGPFAQVMREHVTGPLGLQHTFYDVPAAEQQHYAQGYTRDGKPTRVSMAPLATEAYGVRTTASDLLRFVAAHLGLVDASPVLKRALSATQVGQFQAGPMTQASIWEWYPLPVSDEDLAVGNGDPMVLKPSQVTRLDPPRAPPADSLVTKTGATNGFGAYVAFVPGRQVGIVIMANRNHPTAARLDLAKQVFAALNVQGLPAR
ncbi:beta-lactamase [Alsobacter metallidurans]|uniref:Beta-lactamase n=1 Tax=Alsobacter metallidurans TaxID=340221 RepID=A0A917MHW7_9HYPH|nr:class C beta-lactamase [Alsobacter metallidurans]GGH19393.1 beta-lactamase [Alsobacter metallidurans]